MEPFSGPSQPVPGNIPHEDQLLYVEELAGDGDYWLSITDAARICRVQDVSIRRAIARRVLPVRRQRAGQNKRTRFVRASDLPKVGFPIIDESAAITTEIGKADILSIPRQQQRILQDHQQLMGHLKEMQEAMRGHQTQMSADLEQQREQFQASLQSSQEAQEQQLTLLAQRFVQEQDELQHKVMEMEQGQANERQVLRQDIAKAQDGLLQHEERVQNMMSAQKAEFELYQKEAQRSLTELVASQQQAFQAYQRAVRATLQQAGQETKRQLATFEQQMMQIASDLGNSMQTTDQQLSALAEKLSLLQQFAENLDQSIAKRDQELDHLMQQQQMQLDHHAQLLPLLPYARQQLVTEEIMSKWTQALADLETKLLAEQHQEFARYQPLLSLLSPERLEALMHLVQEKPID